MINCPRSISNYKASAQHLFLMSEGRSTVPGSMAEVVGVSGMGAASSAAAAKEAEKRAAAAALAAQRDRKREADRAAKALEAVAKANAAEAAAAKTAEEDADAEFTFLCMKELYPDADVKTPRSGSSAKVFQAAIKQFEVYEMMQKKPDQLHFIVGSGLVGYETLCVNSQTDLLNIYAQGLGMTFRDNRAMAERMKPHYRRLIMAYPKWFKMGLPPNLEFAVALAGEVKGLSQVMRQNQAKQAGNPNLEGPDEFDSEDGDALDPSDFDDL